MRRLRRPQNLPWLIAALALLVLAGFFRFALIGYGTIALACAGAAAVIVLWLLLPKGWRIALAAVLLAGTALFTAAEIPIVRASRGTPEEDADYLAEKVREINPDVQIRMQRVGTIIGCHTGPGIMTLFFWSNQPR